MKHSKHTAFSLLMAMVTCLAGCSGPDLIIVDSAGAPVEGAKVIGTSLSISGQSSHSDKQGHAAIPSAVQGTKWISVYKSGYQPAEYIDASQKKPIIVKMMKENG